MRTTGSTASSYTLIPKSRAKTAFALLTEIIRVVLDEPKRLRMSQTLIQDAGVVEREWGKEAVPVCGTVGCVAGWAVVLRQSFTHGDETTSGHAAQILGLTERQADELFFTWDESTQEGTPAHAKAEAQAIRHFQRQYGQQLKATRLEPIRAES